MTASADKMLLMRQSRALNQAKEREMQRRREDNIRRFNEQRNQETIVQLRSRVDQQNDRIDQLTSILFSML